MSDVGPKAVALEFIDRINARDPAMLAQAMTENHEFIDTEGNSAQSREQMREGWVGYYQLFPDYRIQINQVIVHETKVVLVGRSDGTLSEHGRKMLARPDGSPPPDEELQGPAIWTAEIRDQLVAQWCVFEDTAAVRAQLGVNS